MNAPQAAHDKRPVFTHGSLMRHVAVMTATGAIGLMAVFVVDLLSLFWVSKLGDQAFKAAVGYVGLMTFFVMSINIGLTIAASATVSRALGAGDRPRARRLAASSLIITAVFSAVMAAAMFLLRDWILTYGFARARQIGRGRLEVHRHQHSGQCAARSRHDVCGDLTRRRRCAPGDVCDAVGRDRHGFSRSAAHFRPWARSLWRRLGDGPLSPDPAWRWLAWRGRRARSRRAAEAQRRARRLRPDHGDRISGDHGQYGGAGQLGLYAQDLLRFRRAGDRRVRRHRSRDAGGVRGRFRPHRVGRADHRPELWRETHGRGCSGR